MLVSCPMSIFVLCLLVCRPVPISLLLCAHSSVVLCLSVSCPLSHSLMSCVCCPMSVVPCLYPVSGHNWPLIFQFLVQCWVHRWVAHISAMSNCPHHHTTTTPPPHHHHLHTTTTQLRWPDLGAKHPVTHSIIFTGVSTENTGIRYVWLIKYRVASYPCPGQFW